MNPRPQNIQKQEIVVEQEVKKKHNPEPSFGLIDTLKKSLVSESIHEYILTTSHDPLSFFLSWGSKTQPNHWTRRMASTLSAT